MQVEDEYVRAQSLDRLEGRRTSPASPTTSSPGSDSTQQPQAAANDDVVVREHDGEGLLGFGVRSFLRT